MDQPLYITNSLTRQKERFEPLHPPFVGMYVCGPTVYGEGHLGHARSAITFDVVFRYLRHLGYQVRYVRNITDVGHLQGDADEGEDKIQKQARLERQEPMEIAQHYTNRYHTVMDALNVLRPNIEPRATGHIPEQIAMIERILARGFAYVSGGSVYFDVAKYRQDYRYGQLSGRENTDDNQAGYRSLAGQDDKRNPEDFALWKKADPEHLMRWDSPWSVGYPGWHIECSAMSAKYLGSPFDIHGGGLDLLFPHHEAEIAQTNACCPHEGSAGGASNGARYWMHNNLITIGGQKMGKSLGNFITLQQFFDGTHPLLSRAYSPMAIRFFILQSHYRSTLDFSDAALDAADKGYRRLMGALRLLPGLRAVAAASTADVAALRARLYAALNDDFNTAVALAELFEAAKLVHAVHQGQEQLAEADAALLRDTLHTFAYDILGLRDDDDSYGQLDLLDATLALLIELRANARQAKNFALSDQIRDRLAAAGIQLQDGPAGTTWVRV